MGARMVEFAGWEMPVQYEGALKEHLAVRAAAGVFDVSHMGELLVTGQDALDLVQRVSCNDASRLSIGQAQYSALLSPNGTFIDDIVVYRLDTNRFFICVNASNRQKDFEWISRHAEGNATVLDVSEENALLAIQGPRSQEILQQLVRVELAAVRSYWCTHAEIAGSKALISRTGYTGEDGFEIYFPPEKAEEIWHRLLRIGVEYGLKAAGLAARNTLRLEMKYSLYGRDINEQTTPLEAGLSWIVKLDKEQFAGKDALLEQKRLGLKRKLVGFAMVGRGIARDGYPVYLNDRRVGEVNSGSFGPSVQKAIGLTYLPSDASDLGQKFQVGIRGKRIEAEVVSTPFYKKISSS